MSSRASAIRFGQAAWEAVCSKSTRLPDSPAGLQSGQPPCQSNADSKMPEPSEQRQVDPDARRVWQRIASRLSKIVITALSGPPGF